MEAYIPIQQSALVEWFSKGLLLLLLAQEFDTVVVGAYWRSKDEDDEGMPWLGKLGFLETVWLACP